MDSQSKIVIFGATGFVGKHLLSHLENSIAVDIRKIDTFSGDIWINCIGKAHDHKGTATMEDFRKSNVQPVIEISKMFTKSLASLLIHISSIAVVEEFSREEWLTEEATCNPISSYAKSKKEAEVLLLNLKLPEDKKILILRPSMIHGDGDKGNLRQLYTMIAKGIPYPFGAFQNRRSFLSIDNLIWAVEKVIQKKDSISSGIYHIADDNAIPVVDIIKLIGNTTNKKSRILKIPEIFVQLLGKTGDFLPLPINSNKNKKLTSDLLVSNKKLKRVLQIEKLPLSAEEGLQKTIRSFINSH